MAEPKESTIDSITAPENTTADSGNPIGLSPKTQSIEPLAIIEPEPIRPKLRTYATLLALYVHDLLMSHLHDK
jgi:hypothetical protein